MAWFDRAFPGHYLRLIKSVSLTFLALVPPLEGVKATLSNAGFSRVMVGPPFTELKPLVRQPEAISVTVQPNGSGLFEVNLRDELLLPFEGSGVETAWTLELAPAANAFDFETLVDVFMTIRYTALEDGGYRDRVLKQLGADSTGKVAVDGQIFFSARNQFPDQWYHFQNPRFLADPTKYGYGASQVQPPYSILLDLTAADFLPNEDNQKMRRLTIAAGKVPGKIPVELQFTPPGAAAPYSVDGDLDQGRLDVTRTAPFPLDTLSPFGRWTLRIRNEEKAATYPALFAGAAIVDGQQELDLAWLTDLLLVVNYTAESRYPV
jgi:hypothetical protein